MTDLAREQNESDLLYLFGEVRA